MKKIRKILLITNTVLTMGILLFVTYAWYVKISTVSDMSYEILQIDSLVTMYEANDANFNGVPELLSDSNKEKYFNGDPAVNDYVDYTNKYYREKYSFAYVDQRYALAKDSSSNLFTDINLLNVCPSRTYTYKFEITNLVGEDNNLYFGFAEDNTIDSEKLYNFEVRLGVVNTDGTYTFTNWTSLSSYTAGAYSYSGLSLNPLDETMTIPAKSLDLDSKQISGRKDLWLQIRVKNDSEVKVSSFKFPQFRITLSVEV